MLITKEIQPGWIGFDTDTKLTTAVCAALRSYGYRFAVRYLSIGPEPAPGDLDKDEAQVITAAGLGLMAVQHVRFPGWRPVKSLGLSDGANAVTHALNAGIIAGVSVWHDLEGVLQPYPADAIIEYLEAWYDQVRRPAYLPGQYVGANCGLTGDQLWGLSVTRYWKSASNVPDIPNRGYCMVQSLVLDNGGNEMPVAGISIDRNVVQKDKLGGLPVMMVDDAAWQRAEERAQAVDVQAGIDDVISRLQAIKTRVAGLVLPVQASAV